MNTIQNNMNQFLAKVDFEVLARKMDYSCEVEEMLGKVPLAIFAEEGKRDAFFICTSGETFLFRHTQDCCESVYISQIDGNLFDMYGSKLEMAEVVSNYDRATDRDFAQCWTFYKFRSHGGDLTIRFHGSSNGYYSVGVSAYRGTLQDLPTEVQVLCDKMLEGTEVTA